MTTPQPASTVHVTSVWLVEEHALTLADLAQAGNVPADFVAQLVEEGLIEPLAPGPDWRFDGEQLARVRRIRRLQRDFEANLASVAVMLDLLDEVERLKTRLRQFGLQAP